MPVPLGLSELRAALARERNANALLRIECDLEHEEAMLRHELEWLEWENARLRLELSGAPRRR